jgi:anti-sigma B factor antagonist
MNLGIKHKGDVYLINVKGSLDISNSLALKELILRMIKKKVERYIINLRETECIDSKGIGALIFISSTLKKMNLKLAITNMNETITQVIRITKLTGYLPIAATLEDAVTMVSL